MHTNGNGTHTNGTHVNPPQPPAPLPKTLKEVRAERRLLEANIELQRLQAAQRLMESSLSSLYGNQWGSFVDPRDALRGDEDYRPAYSPMSLPTDRSGGRNWPLFRTLEELSRLRQSSRVLCETNSQAKGMLRNQANYIIGTGFQYSAEPRDATPDTDDETPGLQVAPDVQEAVDAAQAVIDDFLGEAFDSGDGVKLTPWARREREVVRRVPRDGEAFVRWFGLDDGTSAVRFIDPECVIQSPGASDLRGETLGIRHKMTPFEDVESAEAYYVCQASDPSNGEWVSAAGVDPEANSEVYHIRDVDHDSTVKRGIPAFVYDVYDAFARGATLQKNLSQGEALRAALSWIEQYETATKTQVTDFAAEKAVTTRTDPITGRTQQIEQWGPGTIARIPKGKTMLNPPSYQGTAATQQVVQGDFRQGIAAFCAPEYFTGDASNADYSSTKEAGAPWVKSASTIQAHYKSYFVAIVWRSLRWAERCGKLPQGTCEKIKIQVELPAILHKDPLVQAQTDQILIGIGVKDRDSVSAEWGYDPEVVKARNAEYAQANGGGGQMLQMPGVGGEDDSEGSGPGGDGGPGGSPGGDGTSNVQLDDESLNALAAIGEGRFFVDVDGDGEWLTEVTVKRDKLGRKYCIDGGKRVKCGPDEPAGGGGGSDNSGGDSGGSSGDSGGGEKAKPARKPRATKKAPKDASQDKTDDAASKSDDKPAKKSFADVKEFAAAATKAIGEGVRDSAHAVEVGGMAFDHVMNATADLQDEYDRLSGMLKKAMDPSKSDEVKAQRAELGKKLVAARRAALREAMAAVRPTGRSKPIPFMQGADPDQAKHFNAAADVFPSDWWQKSDEVKLRTATAVRKEGDGEYDREGRTIYGNAGHAGIFEHELCHRFEHVIPRIVELEREYYIKRTGDAPVQFVDGAEWRPGFKAGYMGREYPGGQHYEIMSVALQNLIGFPQPTEDPEATKFALGVLFGTKASQPSKLDPPKTIEETVKQAEYPAKKMASWGSKVWGKIGAAGKYIKDKTQQVYGALEKRYGRTQAIGIFAAGHVVGLATPIAVVPGSTIVGMVPFIAMAETYLQAKKGVKKLLGVKEAEGDGTGDTGDFEQLSQEQLMQLGRELVDQLKSAWNDRIGECEDGSCEADAIGESLMEVVDDSGHEHAADGKFGKGGGTSSKKKEEPVAKYRGEESPGKHWIDAGTDSSGKRVWHHPGGTGRSQSEIWREKALAKINAEMKRAMAEPKSGSSTDVGKDDPVGVTSGAKIHANPAPPQNQAEMDRWHGSLSQPEKDAVASWTVGDHKKIRTSIAEGQPSDEAKLFLDAMKKAPQHEGYVYRGITGDFGDEQIAAILKAGIGGEYMDSAPASTSLSPKVGARFADGNLLLKIKSKTVRRLEDYGYGEEREAVAMPGTKYRIVGIHQNAKLVVGDKSKTHKMILHLEEM